MSPIGRKENRKFDFVLVALSAVADGMAIYSVATSVCSLHKK
jgi:hypothetical protein